MLSGQRSAWRRRGRKSRGSSCGPSRHPDGDGPDSRDHPCGLRRSHHKDRSVGHAGRGQSLRQALPGRPWGTATPTTGSGGGAVPPAPSNASGQTAFRQLGDLATVPVDGAGNAINLNQTAAAGDRVDELHPDRAGQPAERAGPGHALAARRRLLDGERRHRGRVRRGHHPRPQRPGAGVQPAGHHGGHHGGGHPGRADDRARLPGDHRRRLQRHQPGACRARAPGRAAASTRSASPSSARCRPATPSTSTTWPTSRSRAAP